MPSETYIYIVYSSIDNLAECQFEYQTTILDCFRELCANITQSWSRMCYKIFMMRISYAQQYSVQKTHYNKRGSILSQYSAN